MNQDGICVQRIDAGRKNGIIPDTMKTCIAPTGKPIRKEPEGKLQEVRAWNFWNAVPDDTGRRFC
jgi:hypothetical protein